MQAESRKFDWTMVDDIINRYQHNDWKTLFSGQCHHSFRRDSLIVFLQVWDTRMVSVWYSCGVRCSIMSDNRWSYGIELYLMVLHWYCMVLHWYCMVLHGIARCCIVLYGIALNCIKSYGIAWYCIVPLLASARGLYLARHLSTLFV